MEAGLCRSQVSGGSPYQCEVFVPFLELVLHGIIMRRGPARFNRPRERQCGCENRRFRPVSVQARPLRPAMRDLGSRLNRGSRGMLSEVITEPSAVATIRLWPVGSPTQITHDSPEVAYTVRDGVAAGTTFLRNVSDPTLSVFTPQHSNGIGIIVVPGGGWTINAWTHEGVDVARWLTTLGYTAFLLKYRVQASGSDQAAFEARMAAVDDTLAAGLEARRLPSEIGDLISTEAYLNARKACADDGRRAIEIVRSEAAQLGLRPGALGMIGFSAGAFLTVDVALDPRGAPLSFIAPIYGGETRGASIPKDAPPLFTAVARDDILVRIVEGLYAEWTAADRSAELHIFARGAHGFGMIRQGLPSDHWTDLFSAWLDDLNLTGDSTQS